MKEMDSKSEALYILNFLIWHVISFLVATLIISAFLKKLREVFFLNLESSKTQEWKVSRGKLSQNLF